MKRLGVIAWKALGLGLGVTTAGLSALQLFAALAATR
jgi:hypothetical protein